MWPKILSSYILNYSKFCHLSCLTHDLLILKCRCSSKKRLCFENHCVQATYTEPCKACMPLCIIPGCSDFPHHHCSQRLLQWPYSSCISHWLCESIFITQLLIINAKVYERRMQMSQPTKPCKQKEIIDYYYY